MRYSVGKLVPGRLLQLVRSCYLDRRSVVLELPCEDPWGTLCFVRGELYVPAEAKAALRTKSSDLQTDPDADIEPGTDLSSEDTFISGFDEMELLRLLALELTRQRAGNYRLQEGGVLATAEMTGPLPTAYLLLEMVESGIGSFSVQDRLGGKEAIVFGVGAQGNRGDLEYLSPEDFELLERLEAPIPLGDLLSGSEGVARILARLWTLNLLTTEEKQQASDREPPPPVRASSKRPIEVPPAEEGETAAEEPNQEVESSANEPFESVTMWLDHFGMQEDPFSLSPDPSFLFMSDEHSEALAALKLGLLERRGLIVMVGEVGTGKTTILYSLLSKLGPEVDTAYISNTTLSFDELLEAVLWDLEVEVSGNRRLDRLKALNEYLLDCHQKRRVVSLVVDEAQDLSDEAFEGFRLLLNFETYREKLLQIVFVGQPELGKRLRSTQLRQIADRVAITCNLSPLDLDEGRAYIRHRLQAVGSEPQVFSRSARELVLKESKGNPRRINVHCHNSLLIAFGEGERRVSRAHVAEAAKDFDSATGKRRRPSGVRLFANRVRSLIQARS